MTLRIAVPNKGRLAADALDLLRRIGIRASASSSDRALMTSANSGRLHVLFARAQDIPEFVELGAADVGITGIDLVEESGSRVRRLLDLRFGLCKLVVAAPEHSRCSSLDDLPANAKIATAFPNLTRKFFAHRKQKIVVVPVSGAVEITPHIGVADAIVDLTQTGETLKQNHLTLLDVVLDSHAVLISADRLSRSKLNPIDDLVHAMEAVQAAERKRYLMANVPRARLKTITGLLPGLASPTVMDLAVRGMVAVHAVVDEADLNTVIPKLKKAGAGGILVLPVERLVP